MSKIKASWRLSIEPDTAKFKLVVQYHSQLPEPEHTNTHRKIVDDAKKVLGRCGFNVDLIESVQVQCEALAVDPQQVPNPVEPEVERQEN